MFNLGLDLDLKLSFDLSCSFYFILLRCSDMTLASNWCHMNTHDLNDFILSEALLFMMQGLGESARRRRPSLFVFTRRAHVAGRADD